MNNEIKLSLNVVLPGNILLSQEQAEALEKVKSAKGFDRFSMEVSEPEGKDKEIIIVSTRRCIPAYQSINITKESYDYMTSSKECPNWANPNDWKNRSIAARLEAHLQRLCDTIGGTSFTYVVFED